MTAGAGGTAGAPPGSGGTAGSAGRAQDDCATAPQSLLCDPLQPMPKTLAATGVFPAAPDFSQHSPRLLGFTPFPALWSDGLEKQRFLLLPSGKQIDNQNPKAWVFPVGTLLFKTFFDDSGVAGAARPIETRVIRRVGTESDFTEYDYYLYQWNPAGTDADLVVDDRNGDSQATVQVKITVNRMQDGKPFSLNAGQPFDHTLPSRDNCADCHHENGVAFQTFIGFDELRLNHKLTAASVKTQLEEFQAAGVFTQAPPAAPRRIVESDPTLRQVKEFVLGNCVHCHNEKGRVFDLAPEVFVANTVNQATSAQSVHPPAGWFRVTPGQPEMSVLFVQARRAPLPEPTTAGDNRLRPMPPIGVNDLAPDPAGLSAIQAWIKSLK
ncbi:MAG TPA: hypothetical protein VHP33_21710 [Polyangiaceae bacterium]|nr:hypothetical protein [Polyangiaceae bacterium]